MARSRIVKPEFWSDEKLARLSRDTRLTYIGIWNVSDDYGVVKGDPVWLKSQIYPYENLPILKFKTWVNELENIKRLIPFNFNEEKFYFIPGFLKHQKVDHPSKLRNIPESIDINKLINTINNQSNDSREIVESPSRDALDETEYKLKYKQNINKTETSIAKTKNFRQPTIQELISYAQEINFQNFDPEKFINYYEARGWMIGKNKMKSWKAAVNIWKQNDKSEDNNNHKPIDLEKIEDGFNRITNPKIGQAYNFVISLLKFNELEINELKKRLTHDG